jgi:hypothetical protein
MTISDFHRAGDLGDDVRARLIVGRETGLDVDFKDHRDVL